MFRNNVAHSIGGDAVGIGAVIFPDETKPNHAECYEGSFFAAYKCNKQGMHGFFKGTKVKYSYNTFMDNVDGSGPQLFYKESFETYKTLTMEMNHNIFFGETEIPDCPKDGGYCIKKSKFAVFPPATAKKGKEMMILGASALPMHKIKGDSTWGAKATMTNNTFSSFNSITKDWT